MSKTVTITGIELCGQCPFCDEDNGDGVCLKIDAWLESNMCEIPAWCILEDEQ